MDVAISVDWDLMILLLLTSFEMLILLFGTNVNMLMFLGPIISSVCHIFPRLSMINPPLRTVIAMMSPSACLNESGHL